MVESFPPILNVGHQLKEVSLDDSDFEYEPNICNSVSLNQNGLKLLLLKLGYTPELHRELIKI